MNNMYNAVEFYTCLIKIMDHYGFDNQVFNKLPEEAFELVSAIDDYRNNPTAENWKHVLEEAADTFIMLEQFQMLISPEENKIFNRICLSKVHRQVKRIAKEGEQK